MSRESLINELIHHNKEHESFKNQYIQKLKYVPDIVIEKMGAHLMEFVDKPYFLMSLLEYVEEYYISFQLKIRQKRRYYDTDISELKAFIKKSEIACGITLTPIIPRRQAEILSDIRMFYEYADFVDDTSLIYFLKECFPGVNKIPSPSMEHAEKKENLLRITRKMITNVQEKRKELGSDEATRDFYREKFRQ